MRVKSSLELVRAAALGLAIVAPCSPALGQQRVQKLVVDGLDPGAHFGAAVAVSENAIVVGAPGPGSGNMLSSAAFVFEAQSGVWTLSTVLDVIGPSVD